MTDLDRLIEAVEDGRWWDDRGVAAAACNRAGINNANADRIGRAVNGSFDAALSLKEALLPGWEWGRMPSTCCMYVSHPEDPIRMRHQEFMADPARALLLAVLKAYRETMV